VKGVKLAVANHAYLRTSEFVGFSRHSADEAQKAVESLA